MDIGRKKIWIFEFSSDIKKLRLHLIVSGALLCILAIATVLGGEKSIYSWFRSLVEQHRHVELILEAVSSYGNYVFYLLFLAVAIFGIVKKDRRYIYYAVIYLIVQLLASVLMTRVLKIAVGRARPGMSNYRSFPSGHTADMACSASVLSYFLLPFLFRVLPYVCLILMGLARMGLGSHYPFDIIAGGFLGLFTGYILSHLCAVRLLHRNGHHNRDEKETPYADRQGVSD